MRTAEQAFYQEKAINGVIVEPEIATDDLAERIIIQWPPMADDEPYHHDRGLLRRALDLAPKSLG